MKRKMSFDAIKYILKSYVQLQYEYKHYGTYELPNDIVTEEKKLELLNEVQSALESVKDYPRKGIVYYDILYNRYFNTEEKRESFKLLADKYDCSITKIARLEKEAIALLERNINGGK